MTTSAIRERLYDFIRVADEKKVKAMYMMLEDEITESAEWWKDKKFVAGLDRDVANWEAGKEKGYTMDEVTSTMERMNKKRAKK